MKVLKGKLGKKGMALLEKAEKDLARNQAYIRVISEQRKQIEYLTNNTIPLIFMKIKSFWKGGKK